MEKELKSYRVEAVEAGGVQEAKYHIREVRHATPQERERALRAGVQLWPTRHDALEEVRASLEAEASRCRYNLEHFDRLYAKAHGLADALESLSHLLVGVLGELRSKPGRYTVGPLTVHRLPGGAPQGSVYKFTLDGAEPASHFDADSLQVLSLALKRAGLHMSGHFQGGPGHNYWHVMAMPI